MNNPVFIWIIYYLTKPTVRSLGSSMWQVMRSVLVNNISAEVFKSLQYDTFTCHSQMSET